MLKTAIKRALIGFPIGAMLGNIAAIVSSEVLSLGYYLPYKESLPEAVGGEINAAIMQLVICGLLGALTGGITTLWQAKSLPAVGRLAAIIGIVALAAVAAAKLLTIF